MRRLRRHRLRQPRGVPPPSGSHGGRELLRPDPPAAASTPVPPPPPSPGRRDSADTPPAAAATPAKPPPQPLCRRAHKAPSRRTLAVASPYRPDPTSEAPDSLPPHVGPLSSPSAAEVAVVGYAPSSPR
nr:neural Wiskott-Aldrich syndrome protein-like [Oryza sativa Japonica Group]